MLSVIWLGICNLKCKRKMISSVLLIRREIYKNRVKYGKFILRKYSLKEIKIEKYQMNSCHWLFHVLKQYYIWINRVHTIKKSIPVISKIRWESKLGSKYCKKLLSGCYWGKVYIYFLYHKKVKWMIW